jgi:hypothetical protein
VDRFADPTASLHQNGNKNVRVLTDERPAPFLRTTDRAVSDYVQADGAVSEYFER